MEKTLRFNDEEISLKESLIKESDIKRYIIDASVVFKWYYKKDEEDLVQAEVLYDLLKSDAYIILAPELLIFEILNICRLKQEITANRAHKIISDIYDTLILIGADRGLFEKAFEYCRKLNISFYDGIYAALSERQEASLITADKKLYTACNGLNKKPLLVSEVGNF